MEVIEMFEVHNEVWMCKEEADGTVTLETKNGKALKGLTLKEVSALVAIAEAAAEAVRRGMDRR